jgi:hypothetical protein
MSKLISMRTLRSLVPAIALCAALSACQSGSYDSDADSSGRHTRPGNEDRPSYLAAMQEQMNAMDDKIADLSERSRGLRDDARVQADRALDSLRHQREELGRKFGQLKDSSRDAWQDAKTGFADAWSRMQEAFTDARAKFN